MKIISNTSAFVSAADVVSCVVWEDASGIYIRSRLHSPYDETDATDPFDENGVIFVPHGLREWLADVCREPQPSKPAPVGIATVQGSVATRLHIAGGMDRP